MVDKLVLNQVKEQEKWKSTTKDINYKNIVKLENLKKRLEDQNKINIKLQKTNSDLKDEIQMIEKENEDWMKEHESFKDSHSNVVSQLQKVNYKIEALEELKKYEMTLEIKLHKKDKEIGDASTNLEKIKELHSNILSIIKTYQKEIDKRD